MRNMQSSEIRQRFLDFFEKRGHAIIPSASLVPENDPSVLFTTAGMQSLVPYLLGEKHPSGNRLANIQKCVRTQDIDEVGDNTHDTFFEMLGNWSLGDYFKEEAIKFCYEFLTDKEEGLGLDKDKLYITVFAGNDDAPRDEESKKGWMSVGVPENRIYYLEDNWWSPGDNGPCGPDSEVFYDVTDKNLGDLSHDEYIKSEENQDVVEIGNNVFIEYEKKDGKVIGKLAQKSVDFGGGLERQAMAVQGKDNIFDTDLFTPIMEKINTLIKVGPRLDYQGQTLMDRGGRIIADHIRTAVFMVADGVVPSNTDRGYILRRLIRRAVRYADMVGIAQGELVRVIDAVTHKYEDVYENIKLQHLKIVDEIEREERKFRLTLEKGMKEFEKLSKKNISGEDAFVLFSTYGFPLELTLELAQERGVSVDEKGFMEEMKKHQELSRSGAEKKFKGGLADNSEKTTMLHTATHLMLAGLRKYLGDGIHQAGSNITEERTRFDFTYPEKVNKETLDKVEEYVNEAISKKCDVVTMEMKKDEAQKAGVEGSFWEKYPDVVTVYKVQCGDTIYSQELCGGPHVKNTGDIKGVFKIKKQKASSAGVRRIKAVIE